MRMNGGRRPSKKKKNLKEMLKDMKRFIKDIWNWIATDGLLHFLVCYAMVLTLAPIVGVWWTLGIVLLTALAKEGWDAFIEKDNNAQQVLHDLICDVVGILLALVTMGLWFVFVNG